MEIYKTLQILFTIIVIVCLSILCIAFYNELRNNNSFRSYWIIENNNTNNYNLTNITINKTEIKHKPELEDINALSNGLIPFIVLFWAALISGDIRKIYEKYK
jgi:hypothetical protein